MKVLLAASPTPWGRSAPLNGRQRSTHTRVGAARPGCSVEVTSSNLRPVTKLVPRCPEGPATTPIPQSVDFGCSPRRSALRSSRSQGSLPRSRTRGGLRRYQGRYMQVVLLLPGSSRWFQRFQCWTRGPLYDPRRSRWGRFPPPMSLTSQTWR